jgi:type I restriction enzyme M protein
VTQTVGRNNAPHAIIVQQGKLLDFVDQITQRNETPEEYVRQEIAKSLVREYGYPRLDIAVEFILRLGSRKPRADLVVFADGTSHDQGNAYIVVECKSSVIKASDRKEGVEQLKSYLSACPNTRYGMWTNGQERYCYKKAVDPKGNVRWDEVPDIPRFRQSDEDTDRPRFEQLKPASSDALLFAFRRCHNYIAGNQGLQKPEAFWELLKLIFCKIYDERTSELVEFYVSSGERRGLNGQLKVKGRIEKLFREVRSDYPQIFKSAEELELTSPVLTYIVSQLQIYSLLDSDIDVKGKAYEEVVGSNLRGDRGEFFTPRNVCRMAVSMLDPDEKGIILDPACGTGGFLIIAMNHVLAKIAETERTKWANEERAERAALKRAERFLSEKLLGIDLNPNLVKAAKMNMVMNNDGAGGLFQANSLASPATWVTELRERNLLGAVDLLVTNPPFGSKIPIDDPAILEMYDLGHMWSYDPSADRWTMGKSIQRSQPPEILFIERCVRFLKPGSGRGAMVLPDGILGSPGMGYVRQWLLKHTRILASIDMHPDTFQPSTSVQTSVLVFQRKSAEAVALEEAAGQQNDYDVFMALANHVGHDKRGNDLYVRDADGNEVVEEVEERTKEYEGGQRIYRLHKTLRKVRDDNTLEIAEAFRAWLSAALN